MPRLMSAAYEAPGWGVGRLWLVDGRLVEHELPAPHRDAANPHQAPGHRAAPGADEPLGRRFAAYFAGVRDDFGDVELDLAWCSPFQRAVAEAMRAIPYGEVATYGEVAALAGHPGAQRAAGTFCARNRLALVLPCHRVVAAGGLGTYGSLGVGYKQRLLELEGVAV